ncbi:hypothetical protein B0T20DRAFT_261936 [Sordaria brevicollis]|uniref:Uncharacterized protein n=2 Tax=Sordariaceae TaxID=5148 RepID=A0AAE0PA16_SORBR|nr:hypothetical protein B0T20DRAFT_261936 [Sordaria brevicollis]
MLFWYKNLCLAFQGNQTKSSLQHISHICHIDGHFIPATRLCRMCNYTQREYSCGHIRWLASKHCVDYKERRKKCQPTIMDFEERPQAVCGNCRQPSEQPPSMTAFMRKLLPMS